MPSLFAIIVTTSSPSQDWSPEKTQNHKSPPSCPLMRPREGAAARRLYFNISKPSKELALRHNISKIATELAYGALKLSSALALKYCFLIFQLTLFSSQVSIRCWDQIVRNCWLCDTPFGMDVSKYVIECLVVSYDIPKYVFIQLSCLSQLSLSLIVTCSLNVSVFGQRPCNCAAS